MALDRYTKVVLTVIAACLVWIAVGGPSLIARVQAQSDNRVTIAGRIDQDGNFRALPNPFNNPATPQQLKEQNRGRPLALPVNGD